MLYNFCITLYTHKNRKKKKIIMTQKKKSKNLPNLTDETKQSKIVRRESHKEALLHQPTKTEEIWNTYFCLITRSKIMWDIASTHQSIIHSSSDTSIPIDRLHLPTHKTKQLTSVIPLRRPDEPQTTTALADIYIPLAAQMHGERSIYSLTVQRIRLFVLYKWFFFKYLFWNFVLYWLGYDERNNTKYCCYC